MNKYMSKKLKRNMFNSQEKEQYASLAKDYFYYKSKYDNITKRSPKLTQTGTGEGGSAAPTLLNIIKVSQHIFREWYYMKKYEGINEKLRGYLRNLKKKYNCDDIDTEDFGLSY